MSKQTPIAMTTSTSSSSSSSSTFSTSSSSSSLNGLHVTVTGNEIREKNRRHTLYTVTICLAGKVFVIHRRYNEFLTLHEKVKKLHLDNQLRLPGKKIFRMYDPDTVKIRKIALQDYITKLLSHAATYASNDVRSFFNLDSTVRIITDKEHEDLYDSTEQTYFSTDSKLLEPGSSSSGFQRAKPSDFEFLKIIGKGSFGKVFLARHKTESILYAVKVLGKTQILNKNEVRHIMAERRVLESIVDHPFLVGMKYSFQTPQKLYFVLDYVSGGELFFHLQRERRFSEERSRFYSAEISSAIGYLHSLNIIYRDLKPENILLDSNGHIRLTDFGLCKESSSLANASTFCGTPEYLAPEVLEKKPYDVMVDWWCLGIVLYEMLFGLPPFYSRNTNEMYKKILTESVQFKANVVITTQAKAILQKLLQKNKEERLGFRADLQEVMNHEFFADIDWNLLNQKRITPTHVPNVANELDLRNFDPDFTREPVSGSVGQSADRSKPLSSKPSADDDVFSGFSYEPPIFRSSSSATFPSSLESYQF